MRPTDGHDVAQAVAEMVRTFTPYGEADWDVPAGSLSWTCWTTAAHVAHDVTAYAVQLAARRDERYLPLDLLIRPGAEPRAVLQAIAACGGLLSTVVSAARPWHWGASDASGFAALGVNEILVHTYDIAQGLGATAWLPPVHLSASVLARLFPGAPDGEPARTLLWCTGRVDLPGRPRPTSWLPVAATE